MNLSQKDLAFLTDSTDVYISKVERGEISIGLDNMTKFAAFFGVEPYELNNPLHPIPDADKLPAPSRRILAQFKSQQQKDKDQQEQVKGKNKEAGIPGRAKQLHALLAAGFFKRPRTAKDAFVKLNPGVDKKRLGDFQAEIGKITVTLGQGKFVQLLDKLEPAPGSANVRFVVKDPSVVKYLEGGGGRDMAAEDRG